MFNFEIKILRFCQKNSDETQLATVPKNRIKINVCGARNAVIFLLDGFKYTKSRFQRFFSESCVLIIDWTDFKYFPLL